MPNNLTSAEKARQMQQARRQAALKNQQAGGRSRRRPVGSAAQQTNSGASAQPREAQAEQPATYETAPATAAVTLLPETEQTALNDDAAADELCRDVARKRRSAISLNGRGNQPKSRPSRPPRQKGIPPKVETGTTLSGSEITGTQVERTASVTGNEQGTCRTVTGTEYIGNEQFNTFCETKPERPAPKVGVSVTASGSAVSGTEIGRSPKVSGDEHGSCQTVTGSEYLGSERFTDFCENKGLNKPAPKVVSGRSQNHGVTITGSDEARQNPTTGSEAGAHRTITGSQYTETTSRNLSSYSSQRSNMPGRMERPESSGDSGVTGSEYSAYDAVTGSDYSFSSPSFSYSRANSEPAEVPQKVGVDTSCSGQRITGNLVDRSAKVTGNEQGSDKHLTGSQYGRNSCTRPSKIPSTHAFAGGRLTGNRAEHDPKINGDGLSGCQPVTGTELQGMEPAPDHCTTTQAPIAKPDSAGFDNTANMAGNAIQPRTQPAVIQPTTPPQADMPADLYAQTAALPATEQAAQLAVRAPQGACCESCAARQLAEQAGLIHAMSAHHQHLYTPPQPMVAPGNAIHSNPVYGNSRPGMITGPDSLAAGMVSGTPESRYPQQMVQPTVQHVPPSAAQQPAEAPAQYAQQPAYPNGHVHPDSNGHTALSQPAQSATARRITGEGREGGLPITGDNWARGEQVTGTEGHWAQGRNPTLQTASQPAIPGAHRNKEISRPAAAQSLTPITGSSGSCDSGAQVTVSGGARG